MSMTAFGTHILYDVAIQAYHRAASQPENKSSKDTLVAVLFSAATLESYMSQAVFCAEGYRLLPKLEVFAKFIGELDSREAGSSVKSKYYMAHWIICGTPFDRGKTPYQDFDLLVDLCNALTHFKPDKLGLEKTRRLLARLKSSNLIPSDLLPKWDPNTPEDRTLWVHYASTARVAEWACSTTAAMIGGFWRNAPEEEVRQFFYINANAAAYERMWGEQKHSPT